MEALDENRGEDRKKEREPHVVFVRDEPEWTVINHHVTKNSASERRRERENKNPDRIQTPFLSCQQPLKGKGQNTDKVGEIREELKHGRHPVKTL